MSSTPGSRPPGTAHFQVDALGFVWLDPAAFPANFVQDVALQEARVMAAVKEPIAGSLRRAGGAAGVAEVAVVVLVSTGDRMINPDLLRFMADRVGARTVEVRSSNASAVSHPTRSPGWSWPPPGSVRGAGQAWLRSWRVAEDMDRSLAASTRLIVVAASRLRIVWTGSCR